MKNYDVIRICFHSELRKRVLSVRNVQITNKFTRVTLHEIDIKSQRLVEIVLNRASILPSNRIQ